SLCDWSSDVCSSDLPAAAIAQNSSNSEVSRYTNAVARVQPADRLAQLERFAMSVRSGPLKAEALEIVIGEYLRKRIMAHALTWANELASMENNNPGSLATTLVTPQVRTAQSPGRCWPWKPADWARFHNCRCLWA